MTRNKSKGILEVVRDFFVNLSTLVVMEQLLYNMMNYMNGVNLTLTQTVEFLIEYFTEPRMLGRIVLSIILSIVL